jgi:two-component system, chemotaxis family, CheB/CheR fusion protein
MFPRIDVTEIDPAFEALLLYLKESRGFDFTGYKRSSLTRRVRRRMTQLGIEDYAAYVEHLELHPQEFTALFNTILINVTQFFRDAEAWEYLRQDIIPLLLAAKGRTSRFASGAPAARLVRSRTVWRS